MMKDETMPESQEESSPAASAANTKDMQMELHSKGAVLTKAWADLFSFITQYQAELTVKENAVEIAEREIDIRKKQLEDMKPVVDVGNDEVSRLQELITNKERQLHKVQSDSVIKEQMLKRVQSDLTCNQELVEKLRSELLEKQSNMVRYRNDLERYKSNLSIKEEQIQIKDSLMKKMQNQLMKENTELRDQLELERRAHELERKTHEITKKHLRDKEKKKSPTATQAAVSDVKETNPPLDLSVLEPDNFGISNIVSLSKSPTQEPRHLHVHVAQESSKDSSSGVDFKVEEEDEGDQRFRWQTTERLERKSKYSDSSYDEQSQNFTSISPKRIKVEPEAAEESEVFFPLTVSDTDMMNTSQAGDLTMPVQMPGTPSSGTSDSNQGPVPISGPIPSSGALVMPPGPGPEGTEKPGDSQLKEADSNDWFCSLCGKCGNGKKSFRLHLRLCALENNKQITDSETAIMQFMVPLDSSKSQIQNKSVSDCVVVTMCGESMSDRDVVTTCMCEYCGLVFSSKSKLTNHYMELHSDTKRHKCEFCGYTFSSKRALTAHKKTHEESQGFMCKVCGKNFRTSRGLSTHFELKHKLASSNYQCEVCRLIFPTLCSWKTHFETHHPSLQSSTSYKCELCWLSFVTSRDLSSHMEERHGYYMCEVCGLNFADSQGLSSHLEQKHGNHKCELCLQRFDTLHSLKNHLKSHDPPSESYKCEVCERTFSSSAGLKVHSKSHETCKKVHKNKCRQCGQEFDDEGDLLTHAMTHHNAPCRCHHCGLCFSNEYSLVLHLPKHT